MSSPKKQWQEQRRVDRVLAGLESPAERPGVFDSYGQLWALIGQCALYVLAFLGAVDVLRFTASLF